MKRAAEYWELANRILSSAPRSMLDHIAQTWLRAVSRLDGI